MEETKFYFLNEVAKRKARKYLNKKNILLMAVALMGIVGMIAMTFRVK